VPFDYNFSLAFGEAGSELGKRDHKTTGIIGNYASISDVRATPPSSTGESDENQGTDSGGINFGTLDIGDVFSAEVSHISSSDNGVIKTKNSHINIGPVRDTIVGETIEARFLGGYYAIPVDEDVRTAGHNEWIDNPQINLSELEEVPIPVHSDTKSGNDTAENVAPREQPSGDDSRGESIDRLNTDTGVTGESRNTEAIPETDLEKLREKAKSDAVEEVPVDTMTSKSSKQEYSRSSAIREYVKARAGGVCEACGDPAPFKTPDGDPYLHAHHIHELSDGGSDTIDSVAAVCPNCHYRIHHGSDGDEYNQALLEKINKIENTV
jgi:5-methylcytosine-specific restriction endonuclease McrA